MPRNVRDTIEFPNADRTPIALSQPLSAKIVCDGGVFFVSENGGAWTPITVGAISAAWQRTGAAMPAAGLISQLNTPDQVALGAAAAVTANEKLFVQSTADPAGGDASVRVRAAAAQTGDVLRIETSAGALLATVDINGGVRVLGAITPNADATQTIGATGAGGRVWSMVHANQFNIRANAAEVNPNISIQNGPFIFFGPAGGGGLDLGLQRLAAAVFGISDAAGGSGSIAPLVDANGRSGTTGAGGRIWASFNGQAFVVRTAAADANGSVSADNSAGTGGRVQLGAGGATALDTTIQRTAGPTLTLTATNVSLAGRVRVLPIRPGAIAGANNDYAGAAGATYLTLTSGAAASLTGLVAGGDGDMLIVLNGNAVGGGAITLNNENAGSAAANRFHTAAGVDLVLGGRTTVQFIYDATIARWMQTTAALVTS